MNTRFLAVPLLALVLLGVGCAPTPAPTPTPSTSPTPAPGQEPAIDLGAPRTLVPAQTDDTWKTYTNAALEFSFQTPTKGRYAPQWEVKVISETGAVQECYNLKRWSPDNDVQLGVTQDGREFCIRSDGLGDAGHIGISFTDTYSTDIGKSMVLIVFKKTAIYNVENCVRASDQYLWSEFAKPGSCVPFDEAEYQKTLDGIVGTFETY